MTTLPLPPFLTLVLGILLATALVYGALSLMRRDPEAPMWEGFGTGWVAIIVILGLIWLGLFGLTLAAVFSGTWKAIEDPTVTTLGLGGLTAALLGAPFLIWGTVLKHQTVRWQKEGHMTDRISKAVEQLGAEKKVDRIGRPLQLHRGHPGQLSAGEQLETRTAIEWRDIGLEKQEDEWVGASGEWQVFSETVPNLEVRIGAILSLERIAQDSTTHDKGRDHVRVMEILCAYIRENAPASSARTSLREHYELATNARGLNEPPMSDEEFMESVGIPQQLDINDYVSVDALIAWIDHLSAPREDIALALKVIGRRSPAQIRVEGAWPAPPSMQTRHPADVPCPRLPDDPGESQLGDEALLTIKRDLDAWTTSIRSTPSYRLDLRNTNLQRADLAGGDFRCARLDAARMEGADLWRARMEGADLVAARIDGADLRDARMDGADLRDTRMEGSDIGAARMLGANLEAARIEGAYLGRARMLGADLRNARIAAANLSEARLEGANLRGARMQGTYLRGARMAGADLRDTQMDFATYLSTATCQGAALMGANYSMVPISQEQVDASFGDRSVTLPDTLVRPQHWPNWELPKWSNDSIHYDSELAKWRADPAGYRPPPPP